MEELMAIRILLIDDEKALLEIAKIFLEREEGFAVNASISAEEALDILKVDRFDVIVSDYQMPGMNGIELLKKLKSMGDATPFILFTGRGRENVAIDALNSGASFYLQKGGDVMSQFAELVNAIKISVREARAEKRLREEKDRAQQYFDLAGVMLVALDKHGQVTLINKKGCEILGYEEDQILGKSWLEDFLPEDCRDDVGAVFNRLMRGEFGQSEREVTNRILCKGGAERRIAFTNILLRNDDDEIVGCLSSGEDVTEREQLEESLKASLAKYTTLFESLPLGVTISDKEGNIVECNKEAERLLGLSRADQLKRQIDGQEWHIVRLDGSPMPASEYASVRALKENRRVAEVQMGIVKGDGHTTWINVTATPVPLAGHGVVIAYADISKRKLAADALRESEDRYRKLVEGMLEGVAYCRMLYDDHGHPIDWIYLGVNRNFEKLTGLHDIVGKRVTEAIPGIKKSNPELFEIYGRVASSGKPETFETEVKPLKRRLKISLFCPEKGHFVAVFEDVTKRKQTKDALEKSEMKYRQLVELAQEGIWVIDADANTTYVNPRMAEMLGYTPEEMIRRHIFSFTDERGKEIAQIGLDRQEQGVREQHDFEFLRKDGQRIYASLQTSPMMDEAGNYTGAVAVVADITERKRAEEALKKSEAKFAIAFNSSPEMMVIGSLKEGRLVDVNSAFLQRTGHSREDVLGRTVIEIGMVGEAERDMIRRAVEEKGSVQGLEVHDRMKSGVERITLVSAASISVEDEPCMLVVISDVTERTRTEQALREAEIKFQSFMNRLPALCYMVDDSDRIVYVNKVFGETLGMSADDVVGKNMREVWPSTGAESLAKTHHQVLSSQKPLEMVESVPIGAGKREFLTLKFPVSAITGNPGLLGSISVDITESRRMEKALRLANKKLALLGGITRHDAINRLSVLMAQLAIAKDVGNDMPIMEQLTRMQESARILQKQLEFTAEYQEMGVRQSQWTNLKSAADAATEDIDLGVVSVRYDLKEAEVFADPMLKKVFHNLVDNSLRHGEKVTQIHVSCKESNEGLVIIYEDDGVGIPIDEKEKIFERGFGKHTGLGLYLVREVLGITGMQIRETGTPGKGARFEIVVPSGNYKISRQ
jgi:PAS domain S-box-containing protein